MQGVFQGGSIVSQQQATAMAGGSDMGYFVTQFSLFIHLKSNLCLQVPHTQCRTPNQAKTNVRI